MDILSFLPVVLMVVASDSRDTYLPLMAAVIHEGGHLLFAALLKMNISSMEFSLGGALIKTDGADISAWKKAAVLLGGSGVNLICGGFLFIFGLGQGFAMANIILGIFNLLPVKGLDGGSALELILDNFFMPRRVYEISRIISLMFLFAIWVFAVFLMIFSGGNITVYCVFWGLVLVNCRAFS